MSRMDEKKMVPVQIDLTPGCLPKVTVGVNPDYEDHVMVEEGEATELVRVISELGGYQKLISRLAELKAKEFKVYTF